MDTVILGKMQNDQLVSNFDAALQCAKLGIPVIPLCWPDANGKCACGRNHTGHDVGKVPLTAHGLKEGTTNEPTVKRWWLQYPRANIGLVLGRLSGIFVVDVDVKSGGIESLAVLESKYGKLHTRKILTGGGGFHFYYKYPPIGTEVRNKPDIGGYKGIETRGEGGYVVAPPSLHQSGRRYSFDGQEERKDAPAWLLEMINGPKSDAPQVTLSGEPGIITEGARNNKLTSMAGAMARQSFPETAIYAALSDANEKQCDPPLADAEIKRIAHSVSRYTPDINQNALEASNSTYEWEVPQPFDNYTGPPFPVDALPSSIKPYIVAQANALQVPVDLVWNIAIGVGGAAGAGRCTVRINQDWVEQLNVFTVAALPSGERKSPTFREVTAPLEEREQNLMEIHKPEYEMQKSERDILEAQLHNAKTQAAKGALDRNSVDMKSVMELSAKLANFNIDKIPRFMADDATSESVASLLADNNGRIAIMSAEGGLFETMAGRYAGGVPNIDVYLKGYSGDTIRVDRKSRPPEFVPHPALSLCLTVQPTVITDLFSNPSFRGKGLLARFLYSLPESKVGYRSINAPLMSDNLREVWRNKIMAILKLPEPEEGKDHSISLSPEASVIFNDFREKAEKRLRPEGNLRGIADWGNKFPGNVARLAGILHLLENTRVNEPWKLTLSKPLIESAITIGDYYAEHALAAYGLMGADKGAELGRRLLAVIRSKGWTEFTLREFEQTKRRSFPMKDLLIACEVLKQMGYIRPAGNSNAIPGKVGRRPSPRYEVNPLACTQNSQNTQNQPDASNSGDFGYSGYGPKDICEDNNDVGEV